MKTIFIETRYNGKISLNKINIAKLPKKLGLITTIQFIDYLDDIKHFLEKNNKTVFINKGKQPYHGQVLGCDISSTENLKDKVDAYLYIGDGRFHPTAVAFKQDKQVFCFNPFSNKFNKIEEKEIAEYKKNKRIKTVKFLTSNNIGILVSTKPGQSNLNNALELRDKLHKEGKTGFVFLFDNLDISEFDNFNFIDFWVNTACPRIEEDSNKIINYGDLLL